MDNLYENLYMIASIDKNYGIGKDNKLLIRIPDDLDNFKKLTLNNYILMGSSTYSSLPKKLEDRKYIVLSKTLDVKDEDITIVRSIEEALEFVYGIDDNVYIIGGGKVYKEFLSYTSKIILTEINASFDADTYFPKKESWNGCWIKEVTEIKEYQGYQYQINTYIREFM